MDDAAEVTFSPGRRWSRRVGIGAVLLIGLVLGPLLYFATVPPVLGRIVDARTGLLAGGGICEGLEYSGWGWTTRTERVETFSRNGWFYLGPRLGSSAGFLDTPHWRWVAFGDLSGECRRDAEMGVDLDEIGGPHSSYFPVVLEQDDRAAAYHMWPATWRKMGFPLFVTVQLIPHLKDVRECAAIADAELRQQCRQLNTYLASVEAIAEAKDAPHVSRALGLCDQLTPDTVAKSCEKTVKSLSGRDAAKQAQSAARSFALERDYGTNNVAQVPIEKLFPTAVAGVPRTDLDVTDDGIGTGRAGYSARYARNKNSKFGASVTVEEFRDAQHAREGLKELCGDFTQARLRVTSENEGGSKIQILRRPAKPEDACWASGKAVVRVEVSSGRDEEFVKAFLQKFASR